MLKGFVITPVVIGRISIGSLTENPKTGKKMPVKHDYFSITTPIQKDGEWIPHPVMGELEANGKGPVEIPVRIMFNNPENNFRARYTAFTGTGRVLCTGDGEQAKRLDPKAERGVSEHACPGPDRCTFGQNARCKPYGRLLVGVEGIWQRDPLSGFIFRTTSWNSIRALTARLQYLHAAAGGVIAGMPCNLVLRAKSTAASMRQPVYYVDLVPRGTLAEAIAEAKAVAKAWEESGINWTALEKAVAEGYASSAFEDEDEEVVAEFYPDLATTVPATDPATAPESAPQADEGTAALSEADLRTIKDLRERLRNIKDEKGILGARAWVRNRFASKPGIVRVLEEEIDRRAEELSAGASISVSEAA